MAVGRFITFEGGEGVGKSTLVRGVNEWLKSRGVTATVTREPGGTPIADEIRRVFKVPPSSEELRPETEALLVSAARAQHVFTVIGPALKRGDWVLCDRFTDSMRVYQGLLGGVPMVDLEWLVRFSTGGIEPEITFLVDCDVDISAKRIGKGGVERDDAGRFDQAHRSVHERLRQGYRRVAGFFPGRFYLLDGNQEPDVVLAAVCAELDRRWLK